MALCLLRFGGSPPVAAQVALRPAPSVLWAAAPYDAHGSDMADFTSVSRGEGFAIGAAIGGLAGGFLGYRMCLAYSALGDCWGTALWWAVIGGGLGGLIGASAGEEDGRSEVSTPAEGVSRRDTRP
jgi:hypothetical protein